ncbi:hypothetical protein SRABI106_01096 [Rahnella aquatilis]|nr:hypothetical protein SRABI106_01096 [Rahnella aquatilis]
MVGLDFVRPYGDVRATAQEVEQPHTEMTGKTLVNDFQSLQQVTHNATLRRRVKRFYTVIRRGSLCCSRSVACIITVTVTIEQRVDLGL